MATLTRATLAAAALTLLTACSHGHSDDNNDQPDPALVSKGQQIFRFDTFGDETFWTDTLKMNTVVASAVDPTTALSVGLKVDSTALPPAVVQGIQNGSDQPHQPGHDRGPAQARRGGRPQGHRRDR